MKNEAIERDEALEEVTKQERPYDRDKLCQFNITCREGLKRAVMAAGAARQMSAGKYAAFLLANALGDPALNTPPEKSTSAEKKGRSPQRCRKRCWISRKAVFRVRSSRQNRRPSRTRLLCGADPRSRHWRRI